MKLEPIEKDHYYHIYNRGINGCKIFKNNDNYNYFIKLFSKYLCRFVTVYAYCLLNNHFHFVVRIDDQEKIVSQKFSNFFNAYVKAFNKANDRTGSLFEKPFKRIRLHSEDYLKSLIVYVNTNPTKHKVLYNFEDYLFSSYCHTLNNSSPIIKSNDAIELFDDIENFKFVHQYRKVILTGKYTFELY
jgi:REP element-mobilizing transposase RayT